MFLTGERFARNKDLHEGRVAMKEVLYGRRGTRLPEWKGLGARKGTAADRP
jgi:hypothetical protein